VLNGFYGLRTRYLDNVSYIVEPRAAERPEQPRPLFLAALLGFFAGLGALVWIFRDWLAQLFKEEPDVTPHA